MYLDFRVTSTGELMTLAKGGLAILCGRKKSVINETESWIDE
jgi:hypothetical protein